MTSQFQFKTRPLPSKFKFALVHWKLYLVVFPIKETLVFRPNTYKSKINSKYDIFHKEFGNSLHTSVVGCSHTTLMLYNRSCIDMYKKQSIMRQQSRLFFFSLWIVLSSIYPFKDSIITRRMA